jgi:hypothetical protein
MSAKTQTEYRCDFCGTTKYDDHASDFTEIFEDLHTCIECQCNVEYLIRKIGKASQYQMSMRDVDSKLIEQIVESIEIFIKF